MHRLARWFPLIALLMGSCSADGPVDRVTAAARAAVAQAEVLAAAEAEPAARLAATDRGFASREGAVRGPGNMSTHLQATLSERADGEMELRQGAGVGYGMRWTLVGGPSGGSGGGRRTGRVPGRARSHGHVVDGG
jgi:hypothetical protein